MQNTSAILLTSAQAASGLGNVSATPSAIYSGGGTAGQVTLKKQEDCFVITPFFSAGIGSTFQIETLSPGGTWHRCSPLVTTTAVGAQPVIQLWPYFGQAIRVNLVSLAGGGTFTCDGYMATARG